MCAFGMVFDMYGFANLKCTNIEIYHYGIYVWTDFYSMPGNTTLAFVLFPSHYVLIMD